MDLLDRIDASLANKELDPRDFERAAGHLLKGIYPALAPISGGHDLGRDADLGHLGRGPRLLATIGPPLSNLTKSLRRLKAEKLDIDSGVVLATSRVVHAAERRRLQVAAQREGTELIQVYDRTWLAGALLTSGYWRRRLLELTTEPAALMTRPIELRRYGENLELVGREEVLRQLNTARGDVVLVGAPGIGKTRLAAEADEVAFLEYRSDPGRLAEDIDELRPALVVVEDAARRFDDVRLLLRLREESSGRLFRIAATAWVDEAVDVSHQLGVVTRIDLPLLERQEMAAILDVLGIQEYWHRVVILEQAGGRPGWGVLLAKTALQGGSRPVFDGRSLAAEIDRYLAFVGDPETSRRILAHVALYNGVPEHELGILARRLQLTLPALTSALHATTHNGILERVRLRWRVRPEALRVALIARWFLSSDALEPLSVLMSEHPEEEEFFVEAALEAALRGSARGAELAREKVPRLTASVVGGSGIDLLRLYAQLDSRAARWSITDRVVPALTSRASDEATRRSLLSIAEVAVVGFQTPEAVKLLLGEVRDGAWANDPNDPLRIVGDAATQLLPDGHTEPGRRGRILDAAGDWLDKDPQARWHVFARLCDSVLSPNVGGTWQNPAAPLNFVFARGVEAAETLGLIGSELWPAVAKRLDDAPDAAIIPVIQLVNDWLIVADGHSPGGRAPSSRQRKAARAVVNKMLRSLKARVRKAPGLAVRCMRTFERRQHFTVDVDPDFITLAGDATRDTATAAWQARMRDLARRWAAEEPVVVLSRLKDWEPQLLLVGRGITNEAQVIAMASSEASDTEAWAVEAVRQGVGAGAWAFYEALRAHTGEGAPQWFSDALNDERFRVMALSAAFRVGAPEPVAKAALTEMTSGDAVSTWPGLRERSESDWILSQLLHHAVSEVRWSTALSLGLPNRRRFDLSAEDEAAWSDAVASCDPESLDKRFQHSLSEAVAYLADASPESAAGWFRRRLSVRGNQRMDETIPYEFHHAFMRLPPSHKLELMASMPTHWRRLLLEDGAAGEDPTWILTAIDNGALNLGDGAEALSAMSFDDYKTFAPKLIERGLSQEQALDSLEERSRVGNASAAYEQLIEKCSDLTAAIDKGLAGVGRKGVERYTRLRDQALSEEHLDRVFGL